jgi:alkyl hydroperoxide reductase subunit AhpC
LSQLRQRADQIASLDLSVLVVTFESPQHARRYVEEIELPWPMLIDENRSLYRAYGMEPGNWREIFGPASWAAYGKLMIRGRMPRRPTGDTQQLGGDVVIDPSGVVRLHHVGSGPADRLSIEQLLEAVRPDGG